MKVQLIDYVTDPEIELFGTCDFCQCEGVANYPTYEFKSGDETWEVEAWYWDYGSCYELMVNPITFAEWLKEQDLDELDVPKDYNSLDKLISRFQEENLD